MAEHFEIRADYDARSIVVYQAYSLSIAAPALEAKRFVPPFSFGRMTWIKPSFLWMMERSNWAQKPGQENILAVRITRSGWEEALSRAVLTSYQAAAHRSSADWREQFEHAPVHVQWDPERSLRGAKLPFRSIQVGLSRHVIQQFVEEWIIDIQDYTPLAKKLAALLKAGHADKAEHLLPKQRVYEVNDELRKRLGMNG